MEDNIKEMEARHEKEIRQLRELCSHNEEDITPNMAHGFLCKRCKTVMPSDFISEAAKKKKQEGAHEKVVNIEFEILPNGYIRFKRGDWLHNQELKELISKIIDGDEYIMKELDKFFKGSENIELLVGDNILCG